MKKLKSRANYKEYILDTILILFIIQTIRIGIKHILLSQLSLSLSNLIITSSISIVLIGIGMVLVFKDNEKFNPLNLKIIKLFNKKEKYIKIILCIVIILFLIANTYLNPKYIMYNMEELILGIIIIPVFEEILFRQYLWNYLNKYIPSTIIIFCAIVAIFSIYQVGYIDIIYQYMQITNSSGYLIDKVILIVTRGVVLGSILNYIKLKFDDVNICILSHSLFNILFFK